VKAPAPALTLTARDGVPLALYHAPPATPRPAPPLLLVHGTFSNRTFFLGDRERGMGWYLASRGWDVWVAELRGHGRSGAAAHGRNWLFEDWIRADAPALVDAVREATGHDRLIWVGHSAGGVIGYAFAGMPDPGAAAVAGLVAVSAPAPTGLGPVAWPMAAAGVLLTKLAGRFPARALGIGPEDEHPGIFTQWMRWNLRGAWHGQHGTDYYGHAARVTVPVLALAGAGDRWVAPPRLCEDLLRTTASRAPRYVVCGRGTGFSENFNHHRVVASSAVRNEIWPLIADWLATTFE